MSTMKEMGWDFQQYLHRPLWFDAFQQMQNEAEAKKQEIEEVEQKHQNE
jgi:hypothetical protein